MLTCGAAKKVITPALPIHLAGYRDDLIATGVNDDLHVTANYFDDGQGKALLLTFDLIHIKQDFIAEVQAACAKATGLPPRSILTTSSHSHSTPFINKPNEKDPPEIQERAARFRALVIDRAAQTAGEAQNKAEPVSVAYNYTRIRENINRRIFFPGGEYFYQPKQKVLQAIEDGYIEEELFFMFFRSLKTKNYLSVLVNYTAHPLTIGDSAPLISADYPGALKKEIERNLGGTAVFINGACGDNHPKGAEAGLARCERMGQALAEKVLYHRWDAVDLDVTSIGTDYRPLALPIMDEKTFANIPYNFEVGNYRGQSREKYPDGYLHTFASLLAIGPILFVGVPGEVSAETGARLKWESPFPKTAVMFQATDSIGYMVHPNAYAWGGYEVLTSPVGPKASRIMCDSVLDGADVLKCALEARGPKLRLPGQGKGSIPGNNPGQAR